MPASAWGFGPADWIEFVLAILLLLSTFLWMPALRNAIRRFAGRSSLVMIVLFFTPIALRLLLLPHHPVPTPNVYDEFSHLLVADTLLHLRLANPPHPMHRFFETFFVLQQPTYSSIYPIGQGLLLAFGRLLSGVPWTGVLFSTGGLCALAYWMLCAYVSPVWALVGGILAICQFGPLNLWMNCYWGGSLPAAAGCLVFGALPRLTLNRKRDSILLGAGFALHLLTRPFETVILALCILLFFLFFARRPGRPLLLALIPVSIALLVTACQNHQVTAHWTELPEQLSQFQYGVPTSLTIQAPALPHIALTREQALDYKAQTLMHGPGRDSWPKFFSRLQYRIRDYRFFFLPPLYLALVAFLCTLRRKLHLWATLCVCLFALGTNLFPYLLAHYLAAVTCLFLLISVAGLETIAMLHIRDTPVGTQITQVIVLLCVAQFCFWYSLHLLEGFSIDLSPLQYETWDTINHTNPERRLAVAKQIDQTPGRLLIFVRYAPHHIFQEEWVWNRADIDGSRVVLARDLGPTEDEQLIRYYPGRQVLLLEPDTLAPRLTPYLP